jgi:hypothetical protein
MASAETRAGTVIAPGPSPATVSSRQLSYRASKRIGFGSLAIATTIRLRMAHDRTRMIAIRSRMAMSGGRMSCQRSPSHYVEVRL